MGHDLGIWVSEFLGGTRSDTDVQTNRQLEENGLRFHSGFGSTRFTNCSTPTQLSLRAPYVFLRPSRVHLSGTDRKGVECG